MRRAMLTIEGGPAPAVFHLEPDRVFPLGRHRSNAIVVEDEHASRYHAELFHQDGGWFLRQFNPVNGTRVDGVRIDKEARLEPGQVIGIGRVNLRFSLEDPNSGPATLVDLPVLVVAAALEAAEADQTVFRQDELTVLCQFMTASVRDSDPRVLVQRALETIRSHLGASVVGFLSFDQDDPLPKLVLPSLARVDIHLSRQLTREARIKGKAVWQRANGGDEALESESLVSFSDALCVPLLAGETPLGALHSYMCGKHFGERDVRFCEVLAGHLANSLHRLRAQRTLEAENLRLRSHSPAGDRLVGTSQPIQTLRQRIARMAGLPSTVLITGESGVGKELVALGLHRQSPRREGPLVIVNCAAISPTLLESELFGHCKGAFSGADRDRPGLFQQADEGTLFLDEVGELSQECQSKLLRVIESNSFRPVGAIAEVQVSVRIIAATNRDLQHQVDERHFRQDLFFRLQGLQIQVPPLREHAEDIPELVGFFLERLALEWDHPTEVSPAGLKRLQEFSWPGNVRQLRLVLENAVALCDQHTLEPNDFALTEGTRPAGEQSFNLEELESWAIRQAIKRSKGNISQAARLLGIVRDTLTSKMRKYGIGKDEK